MNMDKRLSILKRLHPIAADDHRKYLEKDGSLSYLKYLPRNQRRILQKESKKISQKYQDIMSYLELSGCGLISDKFLRQMAIMYTDRYASSGIYTQPSSYNFFEPFCRVKMINENAAPYISILPEYNHLFHLIDYIDYITSDEYEHRSLDFFETIPDNTIYHFSVNGDLNEFSIMGANQKEFVLASFSIVKNGNTINWYAVGAECLSDEEFIALRSPSMEDANINKDKYLYLKSLMSSQFANKGGAIPLEGVPNSLKTILSGTVDLRSQETKYRLYMQEFSDSFAVATNDPKIFTSEKNPDTRKKLISSCDKRLDEMSHVWSFLNTLLRLPIYFKLKLPIEKELIKYSGKRLTKTKNRQGTRKCYDVISSLMKVENNDSPVLREVHLPHFTSEQSGKWIPLNNDEIGYDKNGYEVIGKTWEWDANNFECNNIEEQKVYVKNTIKSAKITLDEYTKASALNETSALNDTQELGEIYIMRCSYFKEQVYKVGFTSKGAQNRAKQLSSATGVPNAFIVAKAWPHENAKQIEADAHMILDPYRINNNREFFLVDYSVIENTIENLLKNSL
ncbi:MAG: GIY-YIG nuclease family protein [Pseudomonadota bacterium]|nr:GIY-YIG nuclease family protein [Pseudomonadota bacterium]